MGLAESAHDYKRAETKVWVIQNAESDAICGVCTSKVMALRFIMSLRTIQHDKETDTYTVALTPPYRILETVIREEQV